MRFKKVFQFPLGFAVIVIPPSCVLSTGELYLRDI